MNKKKKLGKIQKAYAAQLKEMYDRAQQWRADNPGVTAKVQFNFPVTVTFSCPIRVALEKGIVSTNAAGLDLLKALWPWHVRDEATVLMCRAVLEFDKRKNSAGSRF
jgi:hypothetical protein